MRIEKLPSGNYRVRKMINGKNHSLTFDHEPTKKELDREIAKLLTDEEPEVKDSFEACVEQYIKAKENILSVTTIKAYRSMLKAFPDSFKRLKVGNITQFDIQSFINDYSTTHEPKSVYNAHGLISAVLLMFRPGMVISTTLPQKRREEPYIPTDKEVSAILDAAHDTRYWVPFCLGALGLRLSEVCALTMDDLAGDVLTVNKATVRGEHGLVTKITKTAASVRKIKLPAALVDRIKEQGYIYDGYPDKVNENLRRFQDRLGIQHFSFHKLRHYFASMAHNELGLSDASICALGGWKQNSSVMKTVYRHAMQDSVTEAQDIVSDKLNSLF